LRKLQKSSGHQPGASRSRQFSQFLQFQRGRRARSRDVRSHLGLETTRGWCRKTVERAAPCLFGLYSVVALLDQAPPGSRRTTAVRWPGKAGVTSSDALSAVRLWLWDEWAFSRAGGGITLEKLPEPLRELLMATLAPAA